MTVSAVDRPSQLTERAPTMDDVRRGFRGRAGEFQFIDLWKADVLISVAAGEGWVLVVGHPDWGSYEWVYVACSGKSYVDGRGYVPRPESDEVWEHSDSGWGGIAAALLAGLLHVEGASCTHCGGCVLPEEVDVCCRHCRDGKAVQA